MVRFDFELPLPWGRGDKGEMIGGTKMATAAAAAQREVAGACPKELEKEWEAWTEQQAADGTVPGTGQRTANPRRRSEGVGGEMDCGKIT